MKWATLLPLTISAISLLPSAGAWEVTWHDADNKSHSRTGHGPSDCIEIDNPEGNLFKIDSKGDKGINMLLFDNSKCSGKSSGSATENFSKDASKDLLGFKVVALSSSESSDTTTADKSSNTPTNTSSAASKTQASSTASSEDEGRMTIQTTAATSAIASTSAPGSSSKESPTTSSAASATTSNAAVKLVGTGENVSKGLLGGFVGIAMAQWIL